MTLVWDDAVHFTEADKTKLLVALALADYASDKGESFPSVETLANKARCSIRGVQEACRAMESEGILKVEENRGRNGTNLYRFTSLVGATVAGGVQPNGPGGVQPSGAPLHPEPSGTVSGEPSKASASPSAALDERAYKFADWFKTLLPDTVRLPAKWRQNWAGAYDEMIRLDQRTPEQIAAVCRWARADEFWGKNFFSPEKLRDRKGGVLYFDRFVEAMKKAPSAAARKAAHASTEYAGVGKIPVFNPLT